MGVGTQDRDRKGEDPNWSDMPCARRDRGAEIPYMTRRPGNTSQVFPGLSSSRPVRRAEGNGVSPVVLETISDI